MFGEIREHRRMNDGYPGFRSGESVVPSGPSAHELTILQHSENFLVKQKMKPRWIFQVLPERQRKFS